MDQLGLNGHLDLSRPDNVSSQMERIKTGSRSLMVKPKDQISIQPISNSIQNHRDIKTSIGDKSIPNKIGPRSALVKPKDTLTLTGAMDLSRNITGDR